MYNTKEKRMNETLKMLCCYSAVQVDTETFKTIFSWIGEPYAWVMGGIAWLLLELGYEEWGNRFVTKTLWDMCDTSITHKDMIRFLN